MKKNPLLHTPRKRPNPRVRLLCFPYAGGSSSIYYPWLNDLPSEVELVLVQLPGRGMRIAEDSYEKMDDLIKDLYVEVSLLPSIPTIFFGHSMGARVAYELILMLHRQYKELPTHFIASASPAPFVKSKKKPTYHLPDNEFIECLRELNGTPEEILHNHELMQIMLPILRTDFKIVETYLNPLKVKLPVTLSIFAGKEDDIDRLDIELWSEIFEFTHQITWFDGGHFFIHKNYSYVMNEMHKLIYHHLNLKYLDSDYA